MTRFYSEAHSIVIEMIVSYALQRTVVGSVVVSLCHNLLSLFLLLLILFAIYFNQTNRKKISKSYGSSLCYSAFARQQTEFFFGCIFVVTLQSKQTDSSVFKPKTKSFLHFFSDGFVVASVMHISLLRNLYF